MKKMIKKVGQLSFFFFVSVPLACVLFTTANLYFETKRIIKVL